MKVPTQYRPSQWRRVIKYDPDTGKLTWKTAAVFQKGREFEINKEVGGLNSNGYAKFKYKQEWYVSARIAYIIHTGIILSSRDRIIFIDGNPSNLKFNNLKRISLKPKQTRDRDTNE